MVCILLLDSGSPCSTSFYITSSMTRLDLPQWTLLSKASLIFHLCFFWLLQRGTSFNIFIREKSCFQWKHEIQSEHHSKVDMTAFSTMKVETDFSHWHLERAYYIRLDLKLDSAQLQNTVPESQKTFIYFNLPNSDTCIERQL